MTFGLFGSHTGKELHFAAAIEVSHQALISTQAEINILKQKEMKQFFIAQCELMKSDQNTEGYMGDLTTVRLDGETIVR